MFRLIRQFKDIEARIVASNIFWLSALQIAGYVFPLITMPYLAKVIGVTGFGKIAFASSIMVWIQTIADWGFNFTATRDVSKNRANIDSVSEIFSNVLWARILLSVVSFVFLIVLIILIPVFRDHSRIILVTFLMIPGHIFYPDWFFQAMERMKYITIINIISKLFFTLCVFIFIKDENDYIIQPLLISIGYIISGIIAFLIILRWGIKIKAPSLKNIISTIYNSFDVFINNLMPNLYNSFSTILLGCFTGSVGTGLLDAGSKFVNICQSFISVLSRAFFPFLSRKLESHNLYLKINLSTSIILSLFLFVFSKFLITSFFTSDFDNAIVLMRILAISIPFLALNNVYGTNYMIITGHEKELRNITAIVSFLGFISAWPLIYFYGPIGAALNITITRMLLGIFITYKAKSLTI